MGGRERERILGQANVSEQTVGISEAFCLTSLSSRALVQTSDRDNVVYEEHTREKNTADKTNTLLET